MAIKINIAALTEGEQRLDIITDALELGVEKSLIHGKLLLGLELYKTNNQLDVKATINGFFNFACDRCLEIFEYPLNTTFELVFVQKSQREQDIEDDYVKPYSPFMKSIDITNDVREFVLLAVPMKKIPSEADEKCTWCGRNIEVWNNPVIDQNNLENF